MDRTMVGKCGLYCEECDFREQANCPGCEAADGKMFWGKCAISNCCNANGHEHCGRCKKFVCKELEDFSNDPEHGDNGKRIMQLHEWNEQGVDTWILNRSEEK